MVDSIKSLEFEYKAALIMGLGALVISILIGAASGVSAATLMIRSAIALPVFAGMGFGASTVIKKFVPELYEILNLKEDETVPDVGLKDVASDESEKTSDIPDSSDQTSSESSFQEFSKSDFSQAEESKNQAEDNALNASLEAGAVSNRSGGNAGDGKLGKHIVMSESFGKYEPKIMAQAIRTMLKQEGD